MRTKFLVTVEFEDGRLYASFQTRGEGTSERFVDDDGAIVTGRLAETLDLLCAAVEDEITEFEGRS